MRRTGIAIALAIVIAGSGNAAAPAQAQPAAVAAHVDVPARQLVVSAAKVNLKKVTTANVHLRKSANTSAKSLLVVQKNTKLTVTEIKGKWSKVSHRGKTGWISGDHLKNPPAPKAVYKYTTVFTKLFKKASDESETLGNYHRRVKVKFVGKHGSYSKVEVSGLTGFIKTSDLAAEAPKAVHRWMKAKSPVYLKNNAASGLVATMGKDTRVEWLRSSGGWRNVRTEAGRGWVESSALSSTDPNPVVHRWTVDRAIVRKGNSTSHGSLGVVPRGEKVVFLKTVDGWSQIKTSKGTGWVGNRFLAGTNAKYPVAVYGTLRKGQSAYHMVSNRTVKQAKTKIVGHNLYLQPGSSWLSYIVASGNAKHQVVAERMELNPALYSSTLAKLDAYERFDPTKPFGSQSYNRTLVKDNEGNKVWAYVASSKVSGYLTRNGTRVISGDYAKR